MNPGKIQEIYIYPHQDRPPKKLQEVEAITGVGLHGDRDRSFKRAVTLLSMEAWDIVMEELDSTLPPETRRANLVVSGIDLRDTVGKTLQIGPVEVAVHGETKPCSKMDHKCQGLKNALSPAMRAGVHGSIEAEGILHVGDILMIRESDNL